MILVISGTNRPNSRSSLVAITVKKILEGLVEEQVALLSLEDIPLDIISPAMYEENGQADSLSIIQDKYIVPSDKWVIVSPEYNGSFSGVLKLFVDALSIRKYNESFAHKKVALIGVASGRAGNLRGMEHLTGLLNYLKMYVYHEKLPISQIEKLIDEDGELDAITISSIKRLMSDFLAFATSDSSTVPC